MNTTARLCGNCRQPGHQSSRCPQEDVRATEERRSVENRIAAAAAARVISRATLYASIDEAEGLYRGALARLHAAQDEMLGHRRRLEALLDSLRNEALKP